MNPFREESHAAKPRVIACPPRFFKVPGSEMTLVFRNGVMTLEGIDSIFRDPEDIMRAIDAIEVDESGNPLEPTAEDIAAERGDREQQTESDES